MEKFTLDGLDENEMYKLRVMSESMSDCLYYFDTDEKLINFLNKKNMNEIKYYFYVSDDFLSFAKLERVERVMS